MSGRGARSSSEIRSICRQRMSGGQHQHVLPFVAGQGDEFGEIRQRLGRQADLGDFVVHHLRDLLGRALVQADVTLGSASRICATGPGST